MPESKVNAGVSCAGTTIFSWGQYAGMTESEGSTCRKQN